LIRLLIPTLTALFAAQAFASDPFPLTRDEFKLYKHYQDAIGDPRVQKMKESQRLPAIARDAHVKLKDLKAAVEKGEAAGDLKAKCDQGMKAALDGGALKGLTGRVEADLSEAHGVAYVQWMNESPDKLNIEACEAARAALEGCPVVSSIEVYAQDKATPKKRVFEGLISASAAENIKMTYLKDFAETRYIRLFEKVKSVKNGDDFSAENAPPTAKSTGP
jgi:hypothetical protein